MRLSACAFPSAERGPCGGRARAISPSTFASRYTPPTAPLHRSLEWVRRPHSHQKWPVGGLGGRLGP
eukprot:6567243-Alexandrium_andersonii.AAC.1